MQFRQQGNRTQIYAYAGYDKEKKRANVKMLGSFDNYTFELSDGLIDSLTDDQQKELTDHIESIKQSRQKEQAQSSLNLVYLYMSSAADTLESGEYQYTEEKAAQAWEQIARLSKALKKAGYPKPKTTARPKNEDDSQGDLLDASKAS